MVVIIYILEHKKKWNISKFIVRNKERKKTIKIPKPNDIEKRRKRNNQILTKQKQKSRASHTPNHTKNKNNKQTKLDPSLKVINTPNSNMDFLKNKWSEKKKLKLT
jgi:hypothetical protein